jgi:hypothetical protein
MAWWFVPLEAPFPPPDRTFAPAEAVEFGGGPLAQAAEQYPKLSRHGDRRASTLSRKTAQDERFLIFVSFRLHLPLPDYYGLSRRQSKEREHMKRFFGWMMVPAVALSLSAVPAFSAPQEKKEEAKEEKAKAKKKKKEEKKEEKK